MPFYLSSPPQNPLARVFTAIVAMLAMIAAFMLGIVALAVVVGLGLLIALSAWLRIWWIRRRVRGGAPGDPGGTGGVRGESQVIETEFTVISRKQDR